MTNQLQPARLVCCRVTDLIMANLTGCMVVSAAGLREALTARLLLAHCRTGFRQTTSLCHSLYLSLPLPLPELQKPLN